MRTKYIVRRKSRSGGMEYIVDAVARKYRWDKPAKEHAHIFGNRRSASMVAENMGGEVDIFI